MREYPLFITRFCFLCAVVFLAGCFGTQRPAPVALYGQTPGEGSSGVHTVSRGETISTIAKRYDIVMRDIVLSNNLSSPFKLVPGQRIKLPPPRQYKARGDDTVYSVSRLFGVSSTELVSLNHLSSPYALKNGQVLKLPSVSAQVQEGGSVLASRSVAPVMAEPLAPPDRGSGAHHNKPEKKPVFRFAGREYASEEDSHKLELHDSKGLEIPELKSSEVAPEVKQASVETRAKIAAQVPKRASSRFMRPAQGKIISSYGSKAGGLHNDGVNIAGARGASVVAAENGVVVYAGSELKGSGNLVLIRHDGRWMTAYAHMDSIGVKRGDVVKRGQQIGTVGSTGSVDSPQLHFEVRRGTEAINPERYFES